MKEHLPALSAAGNAAALVILVLAAGVVSRSFDPGVGGPDPALVSTETLTRGPRPRAVVLVVIDGLRADVAGDPRVMPFTCDLARRGASTTALVEALVPSTIAGVTTLATGAVPHPASFLRDFGSPPAERGGLFEALALRGERSFVAGPALWSDLFGKWTDTAHAAPALGASDEAVLRDGLAALNDPAYRLAVFHFSATDEAAHLHGAGSAEYARAVAWCDDAVRQIVERLGPGAAVVVSSDHGVTDRGGHAGPEPEVLSTPLVCFGPGFAPGRLPPHRQRDVPGLVAAALGIELPPPPSAAPDSVPRRVGFGLLGAAALLWGVRIWSALAAGSRGRPHAFWLNLTVWVVLALLGLQQPAAAAVLGVGALAARSVTLARAGPAFAPAAPIVAIGIGATWALLRIGVEWRYGASVFAFEAAGLPLAVAVGFAAALPMGLVLRRRHGSPTESKAPEADGHRACRTALAAGVAVAFGAAPAYVLSGQSLSLSSIDVSAAYHAALHGGGIPAAVAVVILLQSLPPVSLALGCVLPLLRRRMSSTIAGGLFVGISAVPAGEAVASAAVLLVADDVRLNALSLGCLLRAGATLVFLTCGTALLVMAAGRRAPEPAGAEPASVT